MWLRKWRMLVRVWSLIPVTELFLTCLGFNEGILHVVDLLKRRVGGQQGELLPVCLLPSCRALAMLILTERRETTVPEEGPAQGTCWQSTEESSQQEGTKEGETLVETGNLSLQKERPQPRFRGYMKEFSWCLLWVSLCLIYTNCDCELLLDCRGMGVCNTTVQRPHFQTFWTRLSQQIWGFLIYGFLALL